MSENNQNLKQQTKRGLYWNFFNQFSNYGIQFVVGIVMARQLSPSDYGITALPAVFMAVAGILQNGGIGAALIRKPDLTEKDLATAFYYSAVMGVVMYVALFCASPPIADFYDTPVLIPLIRVTALSFLWGPLNSAQYVLLNRRLDFKTPAIISLTTHVFSGATGILMAFMGYGLWSLVVSGVLSSLLTLVLSWIKVKWHPVERWSKESFKYIWNFGNKLMASALLDTLYTNISPIFIGKYYSPAQLGVYNRARGYASMASSNVTGVIQYVTFPVLSKLQDDDQALVRNYRRMLKATVFVVFPLMMMLSALARPLIMVMITAKWEECIILLQIICFSMMWYPVHSINLNLLQVKGRSELFLRLEIIKKIYGVLILCVTLPMGLVVFCCGGIVSSMISLFVNTYYTGKLINLGYMKQMRDLLPSFLLSFAMWGAIHGVNMLISSYWLQLIVGGLVGVIVYLSGALLFHFSELDDVKYLLKRKS